MSPGRSACRRISRNWGQVACVGGGVGTAVLYPLAKALAAAGNEVTTIIGGRAAPYIILAEELAVVFRAAC